MNSTQFFRNKIKNIKQGQDIFKTITKWQNKIYKYKYKNLNFQLVEFKQLTREEILQHFRFTGDENLKFYRLKTRELNEPNLFDFFYFTSYK